MIDSDGIESRMLVADSSSSKCRASVLNRLDLFLVPDDRKPRQTKRMSKVNDRLVQLVSGVCSDLTSKGQVRQCADRSYPDSTVLKEFTKLPTISVWMDELDKLLEREFNNYVFNHQIKNAVLSILTNKIRFF